MNEFEKVVREICPVCRKKLMRNPSSESKEKIYCGNVCGVLWNTKRILELQDHRNWINSLEKEN